MKAGLGCRLLRPAKTMPLRGGRLLQAAARHSCANSSMTGRCFAAASSTSALLCHYCAPWSRSSFSSALPAKPCPTDVSTFIAAPEAFCECACCRNKSLFFVSVCLDETSCSFVLPAGSGPIPAGLLSEALLLALFAGLWLLPACCSAASDPHAELALACRNSTPLMTAVKGLGSC